MSTAPATDCFQPQRLIAVKQALSILGIGRTLLYDLLDVGSIKSVKIGRRRLIPLSEIEGFVARLRGEPNT